MEKASFSWRRWRTGPAGPWLRIIAVAMVVAAILAASGGFGTDFLAIVPRALYWIVLCGVGALIGILASRRLIPERWFDDRPWLAAVLLWLVIVGPMALIVTLANALIRRRGPDAATLLGVLPGVLAITAGLIALNVLLRPGRPAETHAAPAGAPPPKFLARLPPELAGADLWAVEAQDHYLRLHTSAGRALILMRLADAVAELEGLEGARTHRSWWVARAAVREAVRGDGRATLTLPDGAQAPVSRAFAAALRQAGWF